MPNGTSQLLADYVSAARAALVAQEDRRRAAEQRRLDRLAASEKKQFAKAAAARQKAQRRAAAELRKRKEKIAAGQRQLAERLERARIAAAAEKARSQQHIEARLNRQRMAAAALRVRLQAIRNDCPFLTLVGIDDDPPQLLRLSLSCRDESAGVPTELWSAGFRFVAPRNDEDVGVVSSSGRRFRSLETLTRYLDGSLLRSVAQQVVLRERSPRVVADGHASSRQAHKKHQTKANDHPAASTPGRAASTAAGPWRSLAESNRDAMAAARGPLERLAGRSAEEIVAMAQRGALSYTELLSLVSTQYGRFTREQLALIQRAFADRSPSRGVSPFVVHASTDGQ